jgi:3-oxoacyl-[acyl-carrier-protein] synthase II
MLPAHTMPEPTGRRVVLTGCGLISPLGHTRTELWEALRAGKSGVAQLTSLAAESLPIACGAEARHFTGNIADFGNIDPAITRQIRKALKVMCREIQMGVAAAQLALFDAGLAPGSYDCERTGVVYGSDYIMTLPEEFTDGIKSCLGSDNQFEFSNWAEHGLPKVTPLWLLKYLPNMPASHIAILNDLRGPNNSLTLREASANLALTEAYATIARNDADHMIAGATGTRIHPLRTVHVVLQEELATGSEAAQLSRPFDLRRQGAVIGEGAGAVVLEELGVARKRGAKILGEIIGYGASTTVSRRGEPNCGQAMENALRQTLKTSGLRADQVGHIHAHGLATRQGDREEAQAIDRVFGDRPEPIPVVAAKSFFGNLGAGGGVVETIGSLEALQHGTLFPILNYQTPDPECPIMAATTETAAGESFINLNVTPQAQASAILVRRYIE